MVMMRMDLLFIARDAHDGLVQCLLFDFLVSFGCFSQDPRSPHPDDYVCSTPKKRQFPLKPKEKRKKKRHRHIRLENKNTIWESSFPYTLHLLWLRLAQGFRFCLFSSGYMGDRVTRGRSRTFFFFFFTVRFQREYSMKNRTRDDLGWFQHRHCRLLPLFPRPRSTHRTPASILVI